jgi:hypothetical protein
MSALYPAPIKGSLLEQAPQTKERNVYTAIVRLTKRRGRMSSPWRKAVCLLKERERDEVGLKD